MTQTTPPPAIEIKKPVAGSYHNPKNKMVLNGKGERLKQNSEGYILPSTTEEKELCAYFEKIGILTLVK